MPYAIEKHGREYVVVVADTGKVVGTHDRRSDAEAQRRALYANVPEAREDGRK